MSSPQRYSNFIKALINEELDKFIVNEVFDSVLDTDYDIINSRISGHKVAIYRFKTTSGVSYDLHFFHTIIVWDNILDDGRTICDILKNCKKDSYINSIDIGFTPTSRVDGNDDIEDDEYNASTNHNEAIELMQRLAFLSREFIKANPNIGAYAIGRNTDPIKLKMYKQLFRNIFASSFEEFEGESMGYDAGALYFISKNLLK
jgi:hypothetical protein